MISFDALLPNGKKVTCTPKRNKELFYGIISGMGLLGVFTSITLQMKKIYSGNLEVDAWAEPDLKGMLRATDERKEEDYIVGWIDSTARGRGLGRGQMHGARYLKEGEDSNPAHTLNPANQDLPDTIMGLVPKSIVWRFLQVGDQQPRRLGRQYRQIPAQPHHGQQQDLSPVAGSLYFPAGLRAQLGVFLWQAGA